MCIVKICLVRNIYKSYGLLEGRITPDIYRGTLHIEDVNLKDADNYTCDVSYVNPDTGRWSKEKFIHTLIGMMICYLFGSCIFCRKWNYGASVEKSSLR